MKIILVSILLFSCKRNTISEKGPVISITNDFSENLNPLIDSGFVVEPVIYKVSTQIEKEFQSFIIPIKICASIRNDGYGVVDSLMIFFENKQHKMYVGENCYEIYRPDLLFSVEHYIKLKDYNFDNKPDVAIYNNVQSGNKNYVEKIYIFDKKKNTFLRNRILSESANCYIDTINKTISTFWEGGMASMIYGSSTYIWVNDELTEIKYVHQDYIDSLKVFKRTTKELIDNIWVSKVDTLTEDKARE